MVFLFLTKSLSFSHILRLLSCVFFLFRTGVKKREQCQQYEWGGIHTSTIHHTCAEATISRVPLPFLVVGSTNFLNLKL